MSNRRTICFFRRPNGDRHASLKSDMPGRRFIGINLNIFLFKNYNSMLSIHDWKNVCIRPGHLSGMLVSNSWTISHVGL